MNIEDNVKWRISQCNNMDRMKQSEEYRLKLHMESKTIAESVMRDIRLAHSVEVCSAWEYFYYHWSAPTTVY